MNPAMGSGYLAAACSHARGLFLWRVMADLDPRFGPIPQNLTVTREYLHELYAKADRLRMFERWAASLAASEQFRRLFLTFDEWMAREHPAS